jgi:hypothetical protein
MLPWNFLAFSLSDRLGRFDVVADSTDAVKQHVESKETNVRQSATALQLHQHSIIFSGISSQLLTYGLKPQKVLMRVRSVSSLFFA